MNRRLGSFTVLLGFAIGVGVAAQPPRGWRNWRYWRAVEVGAAAEPRLVSIHVPQEVYVHSSNHLADLRVTDDRGTEVPFILEARYGSTRTESRVARQLETSVLPGQFSQVVLDAGEKTPFHNALRIKTPLENFIAWAEVAVSDDARAWRIVCDRAPLYRFRKESLDGIQTLHYSETNARYIRLRVLYAEKRFPVSNVEVFHEVSVPAERMTVSAPLVPARSSNPQVSVWRADLFAELPVDEVLFESVQPEFSRAVTIASSADGENWTPVGEGEIYRFHQGDVRREWLRVNFSEMWSRHWDVEVANGNNTPLADARLTLYMTPRRVVFRQETGRRYSLLYGQSEAKRPQYDLERTVTEADVREAETAALGEEQNNTSYLDPRPWTEQHPAVLWAALIVAVVLLGFSALRSLRQPS